MHWIHKWIWIWIFCRDAEKRAATQAKLQKQQDDLNQQKAAADTQTQQTQQQQQDTELNNNNGGDTKPEERVNTPPGERVHRKEERSKSPKTVRPGSAGGGVLPRYPGSILNNRDPVLQYHKREREKKRVSIPTPDRQYHRDMQIMGSSTHVKEWSHNKNYLMIR